jgi:hypothetical protein
MRKPSRYSSVMKRRPSPLLDDVEPEQLWRAPDGQHYKVVSVSSARVVMHRATPGGRVLNTRYQTPRIAREDAGRVATGEQVGCPWHVGMQLSNGALTDWDDSVCRVRSADKVFTSGAAELPGAPALYILWFHTVPPDVPPAFTPALLRRQAGGGGLPRWLARQRTHDATAGCGPGGFLGR